MSKVSIDFDRATRKLLAGARHCRIPLRHFQSILPAIADQIHRDRDSPFLELWGSSQNFDEKAQKRIVDRKILNTIGKLLAHPIGQRDVYHSGILHTYGYLFSSIQTPYGRKRDRWEKRSIERTLGLPPRTLVPVPAKGTLFGNVSYVLRCLTELESSFGQDQFDRLAAHPTVDPRLAKLDFRVFKKIQVEEQGTAQFSGRDVRYITRMIRRPDIAKNSGRSVLIYSIVDQGKERLSTCFTVTSETVRQIQTDIGKREVRSHYNAHV